MDGSAIVVAGASGNLGGRIVKALVERGAAVKALVRGGTAPEKIERLRKLGAAIATVELGSVVQTAAACAGAACVVSALAGLRDVIVDSQASLLGATVAAGVPRFIPSDYSIDFTKLPAGLNRNLDLRREFHERLDQASISATTIFNGAFAEMLTGSEFRLFRPGGLGMLGALIKIARLIAPGKGQLYPAWQGMQYMHNMFDGRAMLEPLDNDRYPGIHWTTARDVLLANQAGGGDPSGH